MKRLGSGCGGVGQKMGRKGKVMMGVGMSRKKCSQSVSLKLGYHLIRMSNCQVIILSFYHAEFE